MAILTRLALLPPLAALLFGCAATTAPRDYKIVEGSQTGLVVVSFTQPYAVMQWTYRNLNERDGDRNLVTQMFASEVIKDRDTLLFALLLPAGEYEFFRWSTLDSGQLSFSPLPPYAMPRPAVSTDFSFRFKSVPGKATYIGNLYLSMVWETARYALKARDNHESDIALFKANYPNVRESQIEFRIMTGTRF